MSLLVPQEEAKQNRCFLVHLDFQHLERGAVGMQQAETLSFDPRPLGHSAAAAAAAAAERATDAGCFSSAGSHWNRMES